MDWGWSGVWSALMVDSRSRPPAVVSGLLPPERRINREEQAMAEDWVEELLDPGSFVATATGGRSGHGIVDGRPVCVFDGPGPAAVAALDLALKVGCPVVGSPGGSPDDAAAGTYGEVLSR